MTIIASADGSALGNPGPAGWAWYIDPTSWRAGGWAHGTNNMGELTAVLDLLEATRHRRDEALTVYCDSQYVINSVTKWMPGWKKKGWKKRDGKPVLNVDIMKALDRELSGRKVTFEWVKGHAGHELNEAADERARAMAMAYQRKIPPAQMPVGPGFRDEASSSPAASPSAGEQGEQQGSGAGPGAVRGTADHEATPAPDAPGNEPGRENAPSDRNRAEADDAAPHDLLTELAALSATDPEGPAAPGSQPWPPHLVADAVQRERAAVCVPADHQGAAVGSAQVSGGELLHPRVLCIDRSGNTAGAADFPGVRSAGELEEVRITAVAADVYHLSYRLEEPSVVTRRSSVWVREDQHNEMGPWLLRFHQVTAED